MTTCKQCGHRAHEGRRCIVILELEPPYFTFDSANIPEHDITVCGCEGP
jgi:hypothetical protein